jgi:hypothetical protein
MGEGEGDIPRALVSPPAPGSLPLYGTLTAHQRKAPRDGQLNLKEQRHETEAS